MKLFGQNLLEWTERYILRQKKTPEHTANRFIFIVVVYAQRNYAIEHIGLWCMCADCIAEGNLSHVD